MIGSMSVVVVNVTNELEVTVPLAVITTVLYAVVGAAD